MTIRIIGIAGKAGSGKDTAADYLVKERGFTKVGLADPLKRFCREVFDFSEEQLWGPSERRNAPDRRYPRTVFKEYPAMDPQDVADIIGPGTPPYLTPRHALQQLGTDWGRACYENVWIDYAMRIAKALQQDPAYNRYNARTGLTRLVKDDGRPVQGIVIPDIRFKNEMKAVQETGGQVWLLQRPGAGLTGAAGQHQSEQDLETVNISSLVQINNTGTIEDLYRTLNEGLDRKD